MPTKEVTEGRRCTRVGFFPLTFLFSFRVTYWAGAQNSLGLEPLEVLGPRGARPRSRPSPRRRVATGKGAWLPPPPPAARSLSRNKLPTSPEDVSKLLPRELEMKFASS